MPCQLVDTMSTPSSRSVGTFGNRSSRFAVVSAIGRSLPDWAKLITEVSVWMVTVTCPATTSVTAWPAPPLYGMCTIFRPFCAASSSICRWLRLPAPADA